MASGSSSPDARVARLAAKQHGLITRRQALDRGFSRRVVDLRVGVGAWQLLAPGVYRLAGAPDTWHQRVLAACMSAGPSAAASHVTAGVLWGLIERGIVPIEITVPSDKHPTGLGFSLHRSRLGVGEVRQLYRIPVTDPARTLLDLSGIVAFTELEEAADTALRRRLVRLGDIRDSVDGLSGRRGIGAVRALLVARTGTTESVFETRFLALIRKLRLPEPVVQYEVRRAGRLIARVDLAYPDQRVVIELDGYRDHSSRQAFERDRRRQNELQRAGYAVLRFTWADLSRPAHVDQLTRRVLWERGHPAVSV